MIAAQALAQIAAGLRLALILLAVMSLLTRVRAAEFVGGHTDRARRLNNLAWTLLALSVLAYSPAHAAGLLGRGGPVLWARIGDMFASGLACVVFVVLFAARGQVRGLSAARVKRGVLVNLTIIAAIVGAAWVTR